MKSPTTSIFSLTIDFQKKIKQTSPVKCQMLAVLEALLSKFFYVQQNTPSLMITFIFSL